MRTPRGRSLVAGAALFSLLLVGVRADAADFGSPPSGEAPIIFNDHTIYAKPDALVKNRVLAALVRGDQVYVPLRSMFEAIGATVTVASGGRTVTAEKPGSSVSVTLGRPEVVVNGEVRSLDVPPMLFHGILLVPVRVLSEALGAYVQWVPDRHVVVVRYLLPPPPPPASVPTAPPTATPVATPTPFIAPPTAAPTAAPTKASYSVFVTAAYSRPTNFNEFVAGGYCDSYLLSAAYAPLRSAFAVKADFRQDTYVTSSDAGDAFGNRYTRFSTVDGGTAFTPVFLARQNSLDVRLEAKVATPRIYVGVGYLHTTNNYGYPNLDAVGGGIEKLPDLHPGFSLYGSAFYYPSASGTYTITSPSSLDNGNSYDQRFAVLKYDIGVALVIAHSPVYIHGGYSGDRYYVHENAPIGQVHTGPYIGLGVKI